jgi:hypothetical protein
MNRRRQELLISLNKLVTSDLKYKWIDKYSVGANVRVLHLQWGTTQFTGKFPKKQIIGTALENNDRINLNENTLKILI